MEDMKKAEKKPLPSKNTDLSPEKAQKMLHDKTAHGHPLTDQQRKFFGVMANKE